MKNTLKILICLFFVNCFTMCTKSNNTATDNSVTAEVLAQKKQTILNYINSFQCSATTGCSSIAFGAKPCGGPWEYLVFSNNVNLPQLQQMVSEYNTMNQQFNASTGAASDCMFVGPPSNIGCVNGQCGVLP